MAQIDDPFAQIDSQHRQQSSQGLALSLNIAGPIVGLLSGPAGALASLAGLVAQFVGEDRKQARATAMQDGLREGFGAIEGRIEALEKKLAGPDAEEAVVVAIQQALRSARYDKARRFGRVIGATLATDTPDWPEATEFIRNLEELGDDDIAALNLLWRVQRQAFRGSKQRREMSTDANDYTKDWPGVLERAEKLHISKDDWYARCGRLSGFGLCVLVQPNSNFQGPDAMCYRLTGRAVRLLRLLGRNVDPSSYPRVKYHSTNQQVTVQDEDEERALGEGWANSPDAFKKNSATR